MFSNVDPAYSWPFSQISLFRLASKNDGAKEIVEQRSSILSAFQETIILYWYLQSAQQIWLVNSTSNILLR
ncbi:hypothetical protein GYH30_007080 [Glycine max]|nr:hypothetical protein JHK87_007184 [Glycine soja]KAH1069752.1 hypothetical protein GYH30_007080 [Glycine max]